MELEEAIESLKKLKILFEIEDERDFEATPKQQRIIAQQIEVVLNHLAKQEEKNKELEAKRIWNKVRIEELKKELAQEKEKNKELEEKLKIAVAMLTKGTYPEKNEGDNDFNKKFIAVDKIKEKIEDYEKMIEGTFKDITWNGQNRRDNCYEIIRILNELLEGE